MISKRIIEVSKLIKENESIIDVGCDHGYLGILGLDNGCKYVEFVDNKIGPLNICIDNVLPKRYDSNSYCFNLSDGLTNLKKESYDKCFILGMGGILITEILSKNKKTISNFVLGPNNKIDEVRKYLFCNQYQIDDELIIYDNKKYYEFLICHKTNKKLDYTSEDLIFGPILKEKKSVEFINKWTEIYNKNKNIIDSSKKELTDLIKYNDMIGEILCIK